MSAANKNLVGTFLVATLLLGANAAQAMEIQKFDKMTGADQDEYVADLILGAQKVLRDSGKSDLAEKVRKLFTERDPEANVPTGMIQFDLSLAKGRVADLQRNGKDPNSVRLEVEHAMLVTLKKNGIEVPPTFMHVMDHFKPKNPLK